MVCFSIVRHGITTIRTCVH